MYDRHLESFVKVVELGSFERASKELYISANAVIKHVNLLERDLDLKLLDRSNKGVTLTPAGEEIYRGAIKIMSESRDIVARARHTMSEERVPVRLTCSVMRPSTRFKLLWARVAPRHPNLTLEVTQMYDSVNSISTSMDSLGAEADFVLSVEPSRVLAKQHPNMEYQILYDSPASFLVPVGHRLATASSIRLTDLEGERFALTGRGYTDVSNQVSNEITQRGLNIKVIDIPPYDMKSLNDALVDNDVIMSCDEFANSHPSLVNIPCAEGYVYPICLMYAHSANATIRELADELVAEAHAQNAT